MLLLNFQSLSVVENFEIVVLAQASELLVASGADEIFKVYRAVKADGLAAVGALYLVVFLILEVLALPVAAVTLAADAGLKALAGVAVAVALAVVAIVTIALASAALVAVAVAIVITAVASLFLKVENEFLYLSEVVVKLLNVVVECVDFVIYVVKLLAKLRGKVDESRNKLALCRISVEVKPVGKTLDICCLFVKCHFSFSFNYVIIWI